MGNEIQCKSHFDILELIQLQAAFCPFALSKDCIIATTQTVGINYTEMSAIYNVGRFKAHGKISF